MAVKKTILSHERRGSIRADRELSIRHRLINNKVNVGHNSWNSSNTQNMSVQGLLFLSEVPYKIGDIIECNVIMSGVIDVIKSAAEVIRVIHRKDNFFDIAVKFIQKKPKNRSAKKHI